MSQLLAAALTYAAAGIPVLPLHTPDSEGRCSCRRAHCDRPGKHPRWHPLHIPAGLHNASTDPTHLRRWWKTWPTANVGLRTGVTIDVCDIDSDEGLQALLDILGDNAITGPVVQTGSGGWHIYLAATGAGNRVRLLPGVDWRGTNGYVVAPPSLHITGRHYRWSRPLNVPPPECPPAVRELLTPPTPPPHDHRTPLRNPTRYGAAALASETNRVAAAPQGQRNHTLYRAARNLGELAAADLLDDQTVVEQLTHAAAAAGLHPTEIARTISSGLTAGHRSPRAARRAIA